MKEVVILVTTPQQYSELMELLFKQKYVWSSGVSPASRLHNMWITYKAETAICLEDDKTISYADREFFAKFAKGGSDGFKIISFNEYKIGLGINLNKELIKAIERAM